MRRLSQFFSLSLGERELIRRFLKVVIFPDFTRKEYAVVVRG
jgi:hypothetical protein